MELPLQSLHVTTFLFDQDVFRNKCQQVAAEFDDSLSLIPSSHIFCPGSQNTGTWERLMSHYHHQAAKSSHHSIKCININNLFSPSAIARLDPSPACILLEHGEVQEQIH